MAFDIADFSHISEKRQKVLVGVCKQVNALIHLTQNQHLLNLSERISLWKLCQSEEEVLFIANVELHQLQHRSLFEIALSGGHWEVCLDLLEHGFNGKSRFSSEVWSYFLKGFERRTKYWNSWNDDQALMEKMIKHLINMLPSTPKMHAPIQALELTNHDFVLLIVQEFYKQGLSFEHVSFKKPCYLIGLHLYTSLARWAIREKHHPLNDVKNLFLSSVNAQAKEAEASKLHEFWEMLLEESPEIEKSLRTFMPSSFPKPYSEEGMKRLTIFQSWLTFHERKRLSESLPESSNPGHIHRL